MAAKKKLVTKKEAAGAQIETAIKLLFENRDLISAYTLCSAANGILEGIYKNERSTILAKQRETLAGDMKYFRFSWKEEWEIRFKPEHLKEGFRYLNATQNFFKHADTDHDDVHEFRDWDETSAKIFMAVTNYRLVFREINPAMHTYMVLFFMQNPEVLPEDNVLYEHISSSPICQKFARVFPQSTIAAIGYHNLETSCPELFPPTGLNAVL